MVIHASDRIAQVLERNGDLLDVLVEASPHFERLKNPAMRRVMATLVTVEQAARIAGIDPEDLLQRLNAAARDAGVARVEEARATVGARPASAAVLLAPGETPRDRDEPVASDPPAALSDLPPERIVDLDVREDLRAGREPFSRIMAARASLPADAALRLRAIFEPVPLYQVMARQGFAHWTERLADDDWRVWFYREIWPTNTGEAASLAKTGTGETATAATADAGEADGPVTRGAPEDAGSTPSTTAPAAADSGDLNVSDPRMVVLDVRGLDPPEPMMRTLAALESLPRGATLLQINARVPEFLLPRLEQLGFRYEIRQQGPDLVRVFIRHGDDRPAADVTGAPTDAL